MSPSPVLPRLAARAAALLLIGGGAVVGGPSLLAPAASAFTGPTSTRIPASSCFGAAARDSGHPCHDPRLRLSVVPRPQDAILEPNGDCTPVGKTKILLPCAFGATPQQATAVVALVGDSHASHWRAAVAVAATARGWRGISITRSSCPFSTASARLGGTGVDRACRHWNQATLAWFGQHPEVHTVFVSEHSGGTVLVPAGSTALATQVAGYRAAWKALPASVTRIFVIRDTPRDAAGTADCVNHAIAARRAAGPACAIARATALKPDPAVIAARRTAGDRVKVIDLTAFMCSRRLCLPVVGGALVHRDIDHLTQTFATTLGPYLERKVRGLGGLGR